MVNLFSLFSYKMSYIIISALTTYLNIYKLIPKLHKIGNAVKQKNQNESNSDLLVGHKIKWSIMTRQ